MANSGTNLILKLEAVQDDMALQQVEFGNQPGYNKLLPPTKLICESEILSNLRH